MHGRHRRPCIVLCPTKQQKCAEKLKDDVQNKESNFSLFCDVLRLAACGDLGRRMVYAVRG